MFGLGRTGKLEKRVETLERRNKVVLDILMDDGTVSKTYERGYYSLPAATVLQHLLNHLDLTPAYKITKGNQDGEAKDVVFVKDAQPYVHTHYTGP